MRLPVSLAIAISAVFMTAPSVSAAEWPELTSQIVPSLDGARDAAVIVAVEDYAYVDDVVGARSNADAWLRWFVQGRSIPASRVFMAYDADAKDVKIRALAKEAAASVQPGGTLWFVFIGHGAPSKDGTDGLLIGVDADRSADGLYARSVPRTELLALLDAGAQAQTVAVLDACFSGQSSSGKALVSGLQPIIPTALTGAAQPRARVLTAAGSGEFSGPLPGQKRPAFSYLTLGALMGWADVDGAGNRDGIVTAEEARAYVHGALNLTVRGRTQTPALLGDDANLSRATATSAPMLFEVAMRPVEQKIPTAPVVTFGSGDEDLAQLAAEAAAKAAERQRLEAEEREAARRLEAARIARVDAAVAQIRSSAAKDLAGLAPLLALDPVPPEARPVLELFLKRYGSPRITVDGAEVEVEVDGLDTVRAALARVGVAPPPAAPPALLAAQPAAPPETPRMVPAPAPYVPPPAVAAPTAQPPAPTPAPVTPLTASVTPSTSPSRSPWARRAPPLLGTIASLGTSAALYAAATQSRAEFDAMPELDPDTGWEEGSAYVDAVEQLRGRTNRQTYGALVTGGIGLVLGAVTVFTW